MRNITLGLIALVLIAGSVGTAQAISPFEEIGNLEQQVLNAVNDIVVALTVEVQRIDNIILDITNLNTDVSNLFTDVSNTNTNVTNLDNRIVILESATTTNLLSTTVKTTSLFVPDEVEETMTVTCDSGDMILNGGWQISEPFKVITGFYPISATTIALDVKAGYIGIDYTVTLTALCTPIP